MNGRRILVADDDGDIRSLLAELYARAGYEVVEAENGRAALRAMYETAPDLVVLDVGMPDLDGWQTLERIRDLSDLPVIMLTARAGEIDKVRGLRAGADDYVTKPFSRQELLARTEALLRRASTVGAGAAPERYDDGLVSVDFTQRVVAVGGEPLQLTPLEFRLLSAFVRHPGHVLSHEQLLQLAWGTEVGTSRDQVKLYVGYLRRKLGAAAERLETVRGFGYRYRPPAARGALSPPARGSPGRGCEAPEG